MRRMNLREGFARYALASALGMFLLFSLPSLGQAQSRTQSNEQLTRLDRQLEGFLNQGDADGLGAWIDKHMLDNFTCITADGSLLTGKTQARANFVALAKQRVNAQSTEQEVRVLGDTAILTSLTTFKLDAAQSEEKLRRMDVWLRQNGAWKWAACAGADVTAQSNTSK